MKVTQYNHTIFIKEREGIIIFDFKEELKKLAEQKTDSNFINQKNDVSTTFEALNSTIAKLYKKQGAMGMQIEEMYSILEEQDEQDITKKLEIEISRLTNTLITAADLIEDFYLYYKEHNDEIMTIQSTIMWNTICKTMTAIGLTRIADENTHYDMHLNNIEGITNDPSIQNGFISKVLKSGYLYKGKVLRKASVIVNKQEDK